MIFFPPNSHQTYTEREPNEWNDFEKRSAPDRFFLQPENQKQRSRQCAGGGFGEERKPIQDESSRIKKGPKFACFIDIFDPSQQREQKEEGHQNILQLGNPGD